MDSQPKKLNEASYHLPLERHSTRSHSSYSYTRQNHDNSNQPQQTSRPR